MKVPTGIRVKIDDGWMLAIFPRSGLGFKFRLQLDNTVGIIDSDYYYSDNEGHMFIKITNDGKSGKTVSVKAGQGFAQGIFIPYGITVDDTVLRLLFPAKSRRRLPLHVVMRELTLYPR